ncbi:hypothetical protein PSU4_42670 [Pseudonocardia sulfidoxydans NBRC 16205]|uniref:Uncharacterized protein n=2 Tax=Pseudonocardia sulfidoxydans TaxID=54011 RepID=A0A511DM32_9PSEU|nr:hypothetical protein [Pseudonocardia sulfidoxydans]GEL25313.1 hypothetical protein PSU4_42670 [Pseudonocardia sulfidoxydans NBRC 16205]
MQWSDAFVTTGEGPGVFAVVPGHRHVVLDWIARRRPPLVVAREVGSPPVDAWVVLDGGILRTHRHRREPACDHGAPESCPPDGRDGVVLAPGMRVVGWAALRLVAGDLDLGLPTGSLPGEPSVPADLASLRHRYTTTEPTDPGVAEQAELLASCTDVRMLRWVSTALAATAPPMAVADLRGV